MGLSFVLPPESPVEKNRNTRQVSHLWWAIARRTRVISGRLCVQATELLLTSQALEERWRRLDKGSGQNDVKMHAKTESIGV
jgi:hypothetical protein